jgi:ABC-2 type transport system permease protein
MQIFRFEWKQARKYILIWAVSLAICIFSMTPVYYGMVETAGTLPTGFAQGGFFETVGVSLELLTMPLGMYAFLTGFFMIAGGIFGMHLGLSLHTKEWTENTAEFLYTKPCGRQMIYKGKLLCVLAGVCVTGISYLLASFFAMMLFHPGFPAREFWLVAGSFVLITLFFALLGTMAGIFRPNNRSPLLTAGLVVFVEYCITSFSRTFFENSFRKNMQYVTEKIPRGGLLV